MSDAVATVSDSAAGAADVAPGVPAEGTKGATRARLLGIAPSVVVDAIDPTEGIGDGEAAVEAKPDDENVVDESDPASWSEPARAAIEQAQAQLTEYAETVSEWEHAGRAAIEQNQRLANEVALLRLYLAQANIEVDPRDAELIRYRTGEQVKTDFSQMEQKRAEAQQQAAAHARQQQINSIAQQEAKALIAAANGAGVPAKEVAAVVFAHSQLGQNISYEDAVAEVKERHDLRQRKVNKTAPTMVTSRTSGSSVERDRSVEGRLARLRLLGENV